MHISPESLTQFFIDGNKEEEEEDGDGDDGATQRRLTVRVIEWLIASVQMGVRKVQSVSLSLALLVSLLPFFFLLVCMCASCLPLS